MTATETCERSETGQTQPVVQSLAEEAALDNFERAFSHTRTKQWTCNCGRTYFDAGNTCNDWMEGELEGLFATPNAVAVQYAIDVIEFEGRQYANACECWKPRASRIIGWLEDNRDDIATFFRLEKERKLAEASRLAVVD